jgi:prevent-host-death family protein
MAVVRASDLKRRLPHLLQRARRGERVVITHRGIPVAILQPIRVPEKPGRLGAKLARLAALGRVTLPTRRPLKRVPVIKVAGQPLSQTVLEDRR